MTKIFGILNVTPDSFSDGGENFSSEQAIHNAIQMSGEGADIIDIGAESTRPGAETLTTEEEWQRLEPVLTSLSSAPITISLDSRNPETAKKALQFRNVKILNDVTGFQNSEMLSLAAENDVSICVMHSLTVPADKQVVLTGDPVEEITHWMKEKLAHLTKHKISPQNIIFDPGIGFGKTAEQSLQLIQKIDKIVSLAHEMGAKLLVGHSRKSFLNAAFEELSQERDFETAEITKHLAAQNIDYVRVHNVKINHEAIKQIT